MLKLIYSLFGVLLFYCISESIYFKFAIIKEQAVWKIIKKKIFEKKNSKVLENFFFFVRL